MKISILQWNIWTKENPKKILSLLKKIDADIICLQELTQNYISTNYVNVPEFLASSLNCNYHYVQAQNWLTEKGTRSQGNGIFSKFPILTKKATHVKTIKSTQGDYSGEGRVVVVCEIRVDQSLLTVLTTHLSYIHELKETEEKIIEEANFLNTIDTYDGKNLIITGDFNVSEHSHLIKKMELKYKNAGPEYKVKTWTTKPFSYRGFIEDSLDWRLDYIFTSKNLVILRSEVINTDISDHLPILIEIDTTNLESTQ